LPPLEAGDRGTLAIAHEFLEGEGLDNANALGGFLQRLHLHRALELARHDLVHMNADVAHADRGDEHEH
jgi:hypothetical protein